jgi:hypothetical protein
MIEALAFVATAGTAYYIGFKVASHIIVNLVVESLESMEYDD